MTDEIEVAGDAGAEPSVAETEVKTESEGTETTQTDVEAGEQETEQAATETAPKTIEQLERELKEANEKIERQQKANAAQSKSLEDAVEKLRKLQIQKPLVKPELEDFESEAEYDDAMTQYKADIEDRNVQAEEAQKEIDDASKKIFEEAKSSFVEKENALREADSSYSDNVAVVDKYLNYIPADDPGLNVFKQYTAFESENGPALVNHLGANPEKIEALFGKPPAYIKAKLKEYEQGIAPVSPPTQSPKPQPPKPERGSSTVSKRLADLDGDAYKKARFG